MVQYINTLSKFNSLISSGSLVVIDFTAKWCGPCLQMAPKFDELAAKYEKVQFFKVDVDDASSIARQQGISAMPTFHLYRNGNKVDEVVGANIVQLQKKVAHYASS